MRLKAHLLANRLGDGPYIIHGKAAFARAIAVQLRRFRCSDEMHFRETLDEAYVFLEDLIGAARLLSTLGRRLLPFFTRRVGATREIHAVPELLVDELARMIEDTDHTAALGQQLLPRLGEALLRSR